jgi:UDP-4-keto-6-deoxy-N-acetylglucosamine 4-aminotransferase
MQVLDEHIARRRAIHGLYSQGLGSISGIEVQQNPSAQFNSNFWLTSILIDPKQTGFDREQLRLRLEEENIESRPLWKPMHLQPVFAACPYYGGSVAEGLFERGLCLPSGSGLSDDEIAYVIGVIKSFIR